jgi:peroxiredoxin
MRTDLFVIIALSALIGGCGGGPAGGASRPLEAQITAADPASSGVVLKGRVERDVRGQELAEADLDGARVLLISFWATWCKPCKVELALLARLAQDLRARGVRVVAVSIDEPANSDAVREYAQTQRLPFAVYHDADGSLANQLNPRLDAPFLLVVHAGRVDHVYRGFTQADLGSLTERLERLLQVEAK